MSDNTQTNVPFSKVENKSFYRWIAIIGVVIAIIAVVAFIANARSTSSSAAENGNSTTKVLANVSEADKPWVEAVKNSPKMYGVFSIPDIEITAIKCEKSDSNYPNSRIVTIEYRDAGSGKEWSVRAEVDKDSTGYLVTLLGK